MVTVEENILHSLKKNGFPDKKVSLPFQAIFKACKKVETKLSDVLNKLEDQDVLNTMEGDRILFYAKGFVESPKESDARKEFDFSNKMVKEAMDKIGKMDPAEVEKLKQQVSGMSPEERNELLKRARNLFKKPAKA